jgi:hypothetical protein
MNSPGRPVSLVRTFPQPRLNRSLSNSIDQALLHAVRRPHDARALLEIAGVDAATVARLMSGLKRRRPIVRTPKPTLSIDDVKFVRRAVVRDDSPRPGGGSLTEAAT